MAGISLIRYSDHYYARYDAPPSLEVDAVLASIAHGPEGSDVMLRSVESEPVESRDQAMAADLVAGNPAWFPDNGMSDGDVRALLTPSLGAGGWLSVACRAADAVCVFRDGRATDFGEVRSDALPARVRVGLVNPGVRIRHESAQAVWELRWLNLTPMQGIELRDDDEDALTTEPPDEACADAEDELASRVEALVSRARARAARVLDDAQSLRDLTEGLTALRGSAVWRARVDEGVALLAADEDVASG